jgi:hypothetical protein
VLLTVGVRSRGRRIENVSPRQVDAQIECKADDGVVTCKAVNIEMRQVIIKEY